MGKVITLPVPAPLTSEQRKANIDEYGALDLQVEGEKARTAAFKLRVRDRHGELANMIATPYSSMDAGLGFTESGAKYTVRIGPRPYERKVTKRSVLKRLLGAKFNELWEIGLGIIDKTIPAEDHGLFLVKERTGKRAVDVIPELEPQKEIA